MTRALICLTLFGLSACENFRFDQVADNGGAPLSAAVQSSYTQLSAGQITPRRCLSPRRANLKELPLGCTLDTVMASQVSDQRDLLRPVQPGLTPLATTNLGRQAEDVGANLDGNAGQP